MTDNPDMDEALEAVAVDRGANNRLGFHQYDIAQMAKALYLGHGIISNAAKRMGCDRKTITKYMQDYPELQEWADLGREYSVDLAEDALMARIKKGDTTAILFKLRTQGKDRGYIEKREIEQTTQTNVTVVAMDYRQGLHPLAPADAEDGSFRDLDREPGMLGLLPGGEEPTDGD